MNQLLRASTVLAKAARQGVNLYLGEFIDAKIETKAAFTRLTLSLNASSCPPSGTFDVTGL